MRTPYDIMTTMQMTVKRTEFISVVMPAPQAKQSARFSNKRVYLPASKRKYISEVKKQIKEQFADKPKMGGTIKVSGLYCWPWRACDKKIKKAVDWIFFGQRPDIDNVSKLIFDAAQSICFDDDSCIVGMGVYKIRTHMPGYWLVLEEVEPSFQPVLERMKCRKK